MVGGCFSICVPVNDGLQGWGFCLGVIFTQFKMARIRSALGVRVKNTEEAEDMSAAHQQNHRRGAFGQQSDIDSCDELPSRAPALLDNSSDQSLHNAQLFDITLKTLSLPRADRMVPGARVAPSPSRHRCF